MQYNGLIYDSSPTYDEWLKCMPRKTIPVTCDPEGRLQRIPVKDLQQFQGALKTLYKPAYEKLKASLLEFGFSMPMLIWHGQKKILDGHQRLHVLQKEGWNVTGGVPVVSITGESEQEVAKKLLIISSQYGKIHEQGLYEFTESFEIPLTEFKLPELADVDLDKYMESFYDDFCIEDSSHSDVDSEAKEIAEDNGVSQIVLTYREEEYNEMIDKINLLIANGDEENIDDPSDLLLALVRRSCGN